MRKAYVKPVMESEAFVANEYVAACVTVSCSDCGAVGHGYDQMEGDVMSKTVWGQTISVYPYDLGGKPVKECNSIENKPWWVLGPITTEIYEWLKTWLIQGNYEYYHKVSVTNTWVNHPQYGNKHPYSSI